MAELTGFDKFISKQMSDTVQIKPKANTKAVRKEVTEPAPVEEPVVEAAAVEEKEEQVKKHPGGRPRIDRSKQPKMVTLNFQIDEELKQILENLKYRTHKSTVKGVILEAIDLLLEKYNIER